MSSICLLERALANSKSLCSASKLSCVSLPPSAGAWLCSCSGNSIAEKMLQGHSDDRHISGCRVTESGAKAPCPAQDSRVQCAVVLCVAVAVGSRTYCVLQNLACHGAPGI